MRINADFGKRVIIRPENYEWIPSPQAGVDRMFLDRIGEETARATSLVRYAPHSKFSTHVHAGGEELFVLDGVFSDEHGDYPKGTYVRNPRGTKHTPRIGPDGATIFVKLQQFDPGDSQRKTLDTLGREWYRGQVEGLEVMPLHNWNTESVALVRWAPHTVFHSHSHWGGEEILVLEGTFHDEFGQYPKGTWLRSPHLSRHHPFSKQDGATILVKTGHLLPIGPACLCHTH